ncbi:MAG: exopolysaccharide biosynthesis protein [Opitutaceae bacterium]|nr:exopolysaccharide biosynthesis protein [Opitutaceae bacterium]
MATPAAPEHRGAGVKPRKLSEELAELHARFATKPVTLREVIYTLRGRAYSLLVILLALPFITPIPLPGLSTPFGLAIAFIALRLTLGQRPWLPKKLQRKTLPAGFFGKIIAGATRVIRLLESFLKPRLALLSAHGWVLQVHAFFILLAALVLLLPLPIPFSNSFPAWTILLLAAGTLERDGLFILLGYFVCALGVAYFMLLGDATEQLLKTLAHWFTV